MGFDIDPETGGLSGRVEIVAYPERLVARLHDQEAIAARAVERSVQKRHALFARMIEEQGLRAQLSSGSLLTGQLYVAFDFFPDTPQATIDWSKETPVLPLVPSTLLDVEAKLTGILAKIDKLPFEPIGKNVNTALETITQATKSVAKTVNHIDLVLTPGLQSAIAEFRRALVSANRVINSTDATLVGKNAPGQHELREALQEVSSAARSLRVLTDYLERHPDKPRRNPDASTHPSHQPPSRADPHGRMRVVATLSLLHPQQREHTGRPSIIRSARGRGPGFRTLGGGPPRDRRH